jgi:synaptobrevin homolog YKT6
MPVVFSVVLYKWDSTDAIEVSAHHNLSKIDFFKRSVVKDLLKFHSKTIVTRTNKGQRLTVVIEETLGKCHSYVNENGLAGTVVTDPEYPMRVAFQLLSECMAKFEAQHGTRWTTVTKDTELEFKTGADLLNKYQNPAEADKISKIEKELDEVKGIVIKSMDDILKRGETMEALLQKSSDLNDVSKQFYRTAKQNNQCCKMY